MLSDEASFCLNDSINCKNCRHWSNPNPHWMMKAHIQFPEKLNIWTGIVDHNILEPIGKVFRKYEIS